MVLRVLAPEAKGYLLVSIPKACQFGILADENPFHHTHRTGHDATFLMRLWD